MAGGALTGGETSGRQSRGMGRGTGWQAPGVRGREQLL